MDPSDALVLEHEGERLQFRCDFGTLLAFEEMGDWRIVLQEAIGFQKPSSLFTIAALFTGRTYEDIVRISPPVAKVQVMITGAWSYCMEGPEGLRRYMDAAAKEDAAPEEGKPKPGDWVKAYWHRFVSLFG